jgi:UDP-N-acetylglucosamine 1-carboxyvinyltransferase
MGAEITLENGYIKAKTKKLVGAKITNDVVTVTGTENLMMAACLAEGKTVLENAAQEPEIVDLANFLRSMGARISGDGTNKIQIIGKKALNGASHKIIFDRIEAGTFFCAVAACGGDVFLNGVNKEAMGMTLQKLRECGGEISEEKSGIRIKFFGRPNSVDFQTSPFPGFATDMQAQFMAVNAVANGTGVIKESIFENRFMHVQEMLRLGARISVSGNTSTVTGVEVLRGAKVMATDLRASAGLVIAAMAAHGNSTIDRIYHLDRGYEQMDKKLNSLGAFVERVQN